MTDQPDRLDEFRDYRDELYGKNLAGPKDLIDIRVDALDWLIDQVETLRAQVERLRGLLRRLEWVELCDGGIDGCGGCPVCHGHEKGRGHDPDCWLAAELT